MRYVTKGHISCVKIRYTKEQIKEKWAAILGEHKNIVVEVQRKE